MKTTRSERRQRIRDELAARLAARRPPPPERVRNPPMTVADAVEFLRNGERPTKPPAKGYEPKIYVYAMRHRRSGLIKIGISNHPSTRANTVMYDKSAWELGMRPIDHVDVLGVTVGSKEAEAELHQRFAASWVGWEWFRPTPEVMAWVETLEQENG